MESNRKGREEGRQLLYGRKKGEYDGKKGGYGGKKGGYGGKKGGYGNRYSNGYAPVDNDEDRCVCVDLLAPGRRGGVSMIVTVALVEMMIVVVKE